MRSIAPKRRVFFGILLIVAADGLARPHAAVGAEPQACPLVAAGKPACTVVLLSPRESDLLVMRAAGVLVDTVRRWTGADLPIRKPGGATAADLPGGPLVVLTTPDRLGDFLSADEMAGGPLRRVAFLDDQGFACTTVERRGVPHVFVVGRTAAGVFQGAVYLRDFLIDGTRDDLRIDPATVVRSPRLSGRAAYTLTIWGHEARYTAADWESVFNSFARDGFDRVYFWLSGHFPSRKFPQAYRCKDGEFDSTVDTGIGTIEDHRRIIRAAHDRGLKLYLGGALGGWCCTCFLTNHAPGTIKTAGPDGPYPAESSLCPSHPASRRALVEYYAEMFDALPEADGLFIESADEWGACHCESCRRPVDDLGSRQFGQSQLTLIQEILHAIWRDHPHARLCYTIGYAEHRRDPAYYRLVREMSDPRIEWMEARDSWAFPGPNGTTRPAAYFSPRVMRWRQYYGRPLEELVRDADRAVDLGFYGLITAFEPGFATGCFSKEIPYPTDALPYVLTGFVWREATWDPGLSVERMQQRVGRRFFGREAPAALAGDLWALREMIRTTAGGEKMTPERHQTLAAIEARVAEARATAGPRTAETLALMTKAIAEIRSHAVTKPRKDRATD